MSKIATNNDKNKKRAKRNFVGISVSNELYGDIMLYKKQTRRGSIADTARALLSEILDIKNNRIINN